MPSVIVETFFWHQLVIGGIVIVLTVGCSIFGLELWHGRPWHRAARKKDEKYPEGLNDAIGGALSVLGVFYGVTVGLVAVDVWQRHSAAEDLTSREAAAIQSFFLSVQAEHILGNLNLGLLDSRKQPDFGLNAQIIDSELCTPLARLSADYLTAVTKEVWTQQQQGAPANTIVEDRKKLQWMRLRLQAFEPTGFGQEARYAEALRGLGHLSELRRRRIDALDEHMGLAMWIIILLGAVCTMCVTYQLWLRDVWQHRVLIGLLSGGLSLAIWMIAGNNWPFLGDASISTESYKGVKWIIGASESVKPQKECVDALGSR